MHKAVVIIKRELRIDRNDFVAHEDGGIDYLAILKWILHLVHPGRENVLEDGLEIIFAEDAALFRILQDVLQIL